MAAQRLVIFKCLYLMLSHDELQKCQTLTLIPLKTNCLISLHFTCDQRRLSPNTAKWSILHCSSSLKTDPSQNLPTQKFFPHCDDDLLFLKVFLVSATQGCWTSCQQEVNNTFAHAQTSSSCGFENEENICLRRMSAKSVFILEVQTAITE